MHSITTKSGLVAGWASFTPRVPKELYTHQVMERSDLCWKMVQRDNSAQCKGDEAKYYLTCCFLVSL